MSEKWIVALLMCGLFGLTAGARAEVIAWRRQTLDAENINESAAIVDINRDGKLDVIAGRFWYEAPTWKRHFVRDVEMIRGRNDDYSSLPLDVNEVEIEGENGVHWTVPARAGVAATPGPARAGHYFVTWKGQRPGSTLVPVNLTSSAESNLAEHPLELPRGRAVRMKKASEVGDAVTDWSWLFAMVALVAFILDIFWITRAPKRVPLPKGAPPSPLRSAEGAA